MIYGKEIEVNMRILFLFLSAVLFLFLSAVFLSSCTINITITDTHGYANDLVDETAKTEADPDVSIPVKPI